MTAQQYLESLIGGTKVSSIPVQTSELELLLKLLVAEQGCDKGWGLIKK